MDLSQTKLTRPEWTAIEHPISANELCIVKFIQRGYKDVNLRENKLISLASYLKVSLDLYLYHEYFHARIHALDSTFQVPAKNSVVLNKASKIRLGTITTQLPKTLYEFILLDICESKDYFTLQWMAKLHVSQVNDYVMKFIQHTLSLYLPNYTELVLNSVALLEKNAYVKYRDMTLYDHQKQLFTLAKNPEPKLILYSAPTGTGKTLSPIGLSEQYKIIFVCGARHIGLAFATQCIALNIPIAFAFGCNEPNDIKLHYYAVKECTRNKRTGNIQKVNNAVADKVQIIISDLYSYLHAMNKMLETTEACNIIKYWDEPTISLDKKEHPLHELIQKNWRDNVIPNVVLSSATLPKAEEIASTLQGFRVKFEGASIYTIISHDSTKTIQLLNPQNQIELPHYHCPTHDNLKTCISHIESKLILLKYMDLGTILQFIKTLDLPENLLMHNYFTRLDEITVTNIKVYYLTCLKRIQANEWAILFEKEKMRRTQLYSTIHICSEDAWTLTHGPTIYLTENVQQIASYCLKTAAIPETILADILKNLSYNNAISDKMAVLEKDIEDKNKDSDKEKKMADGRVNVDVKRLQTDLDKLQHMIKPITLPDMYIPNRRDHLRRFSKSDQLGTSFTSDVDMYTIEKILATDVDNSLKLLVMMGIGVFDKSVDIKYTEIVKQLAVDKKLYLIIATKDYIYGTNYQFSNAYIGKDLVESMTQEMLIQAAGRVGRWEQVPYTIRFRHLDLIRLLFLPQVSSPEVDNMRRLF